MTLTIRTVVAVATTSLVAVNPGLAQTRGVTAEDYYAFETLSDPHFSPDGSTIDTPSPRSIRNRISGAARSGASRPTAPDRPCR